MALCAPALLLALVLRVLFLASIPEGFYGADSNSYFDPAVEWWTNHELKFAEKRRGIYPLILIAAPVFPGNTAQFMAVLQHALGFAVIVAVGWITGHVTRLRVLWVPVVTCLCAIAPRMLWYEHELIADSMVLAVFAVALALAFPVKRLRDWRLSVFLFAALLIVLVKPHGRPIWLGLALAAALVTGNPWRWGWRNFALLAVAVAAMLATGSSQQGGWLFLSSALPLVNTEGESFKEFRQELKPVVERLRADWQEYPWLQKTYKKTLGSKDEERGISAEWSNLMRDRKRYGKATKRLAMEAVLAHPFRFIQLALTKIGIALSADPVTVLDKTEPQKFWDEQDERNDKRWEKRPEECRLVYERDENAYRAMVTERRSRKGLVPMKVFGITKPLGLVSRTGPPASHSLRFTWFAAAVGLGLVALLCRRAWPEAALLLLPATLYLAMVYSVGDAMPRYLLAVDWLPPVLAALGADWLFWRLWSLARHTKTNARTIQGA